MNDQLREFEAELKTLRDCSFNTVKAYITQVKSIVNWFDVNKIDSVNANRDDFIKWKESLSGKSPKTIALMITAGKQYWKWMNETGKSSSVWPESIRQRIKDQVPTDVPTASQFLEIRGKIKGGKYEKAVEFLAGTGLRIQAMLTIRRKHIRLDGRPHIMVDGDMACKGKIAGLIPVSPYVGRLVLEIVKDKKDDDLLFELSERTLQYAVNKLSPQGLSLCPHSLRHFYCSMLYYKNFDGGRNDPVYVRDAAGHSSIAVTDKYLRLARQVCQSEEQWDLWAEGKQNANTSV